ncbi:hypothetical protein ACIA5D_19385 [Actinoplanes sp. NPDC051513]|uniref:hypothetical protein n=1 Tax=Actinoplanes sp. NPDC051513 TaxID=3363908 RepID=UPI0037B5FA82
MQPSRTVAVVEISEDGVTCSEATVAGLLRPAAGNAPCRWLHVSDPEDVPPALRVAEPRPGATWQHFRIPFAEIHRDDVWGLHLAETQVVVQVTDGAVVSFVDGPDSPAVESARARLRDSLPLRAAGPTGVVSALLLAAVASIGAAHPAVADNLDRVTDDGGWSWRAIDMAFAAREQALRLHGLARRLNTERSRLPDGMAAAETAAAMTEMAILAEWAAEVSSFVQGKVAMYQNQTMARLAAWSLSAVVPSILIALVSFIAAVSPVGRDPIFLCVAAVTIAGVCLGVYVFLRRRGLL